MTVTATITASMSASQNGPNSYADTFAPRLTKVLGTANGTAADQADIIYAAERSVASASNDDIDLSGVLTDAFGVTITMAEMVGPLSASTLH